ncbi:MAG: type II secretion system protein [Ruminococcaceae bacterium]|nr:type II secretion system protein [Oscillospiraceae bacterium]
MFKLIHNRKGMSLVELIVTVAVVGLVIVLSGTAFSLFANTHEKAATRWQVQNAVRLASAKFETETDLIANSKILDVFYDETIANGILYDEATNTFTWKDGKTPYVVPNEGSKDEDYSYIFSTPAWDKNDEDHYLGYFLFIKDCKETTSTLFLDSEGFGEVPVQVEFSIATDELQHETGDPSYQSNGVNLVMKSGNENITEFQVETVYILENFSATKVINHDGDNLILEEDWVVDNVAKAYPCGWSDETINSGNKEQHGYPKTATNYGENNSKVYNFKSSELQNTGNVLRFLSPLSDMKVEDGEGQGTTSHKASCIQTWLFSDGTEASERVLDNFRNFRDNVLRGTEIGDWFISFYYNDLSPFMIENTAFLRPVLKFVSEPLSYICDFIANL